jgi:LmbE family N-acetylglucosaminyl deacetylase
VSGPASPTTPGGIDPAPWDRLFGALTATTLSELRQRLGVGRAAALVVVSAHPDDETIGAGRLAHAWARTGGSTHALLLTDGEACFDHIGQAVADLADVRRREWRLATGILGFRDGRRVGLPDGRLDRHRIEITEQLKSFLDSVSAPQIVLAAPAADDPHPDHEAAGTVTRRVAASGRLPFLEYPVWMPYWTRPETLGPRVLDLLTLQTAAEDELAFRRACTAYRSQLRSVAPGVGPVVPDDAVARHRKQLLFVPSTDR